MNILLPIVQPDRLYDWAKQLTVKLQQGFAAIQQEPRPGVIVLWSDDAAAIGDGYLECDGTEYSKATYVVLGRLFADSTPGNFTVPNVTAPTGTTAYIKT